MYVSNHDVHFKYLTTLCVDYTSVKLGRKKAMGAPGGLVVVTATGPSLEFQEVVMLRWRE